MNYADDFIRDLYLIANREYRPWNKAKYSPETSISDLEDRYFSRNVLAWTDLKKIVMNKAIPYLMRPFVLAHEFKHIEFGLKSREQDEDRVSAEAAYDLGMAVAPA